MKGGTRSKEETIRFWC